MEIKRAIDNVYWLYNGTKKLASLNLVKDQTVYGERLFNIAGRQYREWIPSRSKIAAAFYNGLRDIGIKPGYNVLYLGASSGTTVSHVSDIVSEKGAVYAVEISEEMGSRLVLLAEKRRNIFPIIEDANKIDNYKTMVPKCDFLYEDVAQRNQAEIFLKNADAFLKKGASGAIAIKARSIDVSKSSRSVIEETLKTLRTRLEIVTSIDLRPYQRDHALILVRKK